MIRAQLLEDIYWLDYEEQRKIDETDYQKCIDAETQCEIELYEKSI